MTTLYGIIFAISLLMIAAYFFVDRKRDIWLLLLFICVSVCDLGYFLLSIAKNLVFALWANRIAYLGSIFLPFSILMMIMNLSRFTYPKWLPRILIVINLVMLLIASSGGWLTIYYKSVSFEVINGGGTLVKDYGPLHNFYKVFLFAYFSAMIAIIAYTAIKKTVVSSKHTMFLAFVVIGNIAIWLVENMIHSSFEFISISYIVTEVLILFLYGILQDYGLADTKKISDSAVVISQNTSENVVSPETVKSFSDEQIESILNNWKAVETLSQREKEVLRFLLENKKRKVIAETLFITESTIKKHTAAIYRKLETANRTELFEKAKEYFLQS